MTKCLEWSFASVIALAGVCLMVFGIWGMTLWGVTLNDTSGLWVVRAVMGVAAVAGLLAILVALDVVSKCFLSDSFINFCKTTSAGVVFLWMRRYQGLVHLRRVLW